MPLLSKLRAIPHQSPSPATSADTWIDLLSEINILTVESAMNTPMNLIIFKINSLPTSSRTKSYFSGYVWTISEYSAFIASLSQYLLLKSTPMGLSEVAYQTLSANCYPTGNSQLDEILMGGYPANRIIEIQGKSNAGKTFLLSCLVGNMIAMKDSIHSALYIDASNSFSIFNITDISMAVITADVIRESPSDTANGFKDRIAKRYINAMSKLDVAKVTTIWQLLDLLTTVNVDIRKRYNIIVVDSIYNLLAPILLDSTNYPNRYSSSHRTGTTLPGATTAVPTQPPNPRKYIDQLLSTLSILSKRIVSDSKVNPTMLFTNPTFTASSHQPSHESTSSSCRVIDSSIYSEMFDMSILLTSENIPTYQALAESVDAVGDGGVYSQVPEPSDIPVTRVDVLSQLPIFGTPLQGGHIQLHKS